VLLGAVLFGHSPLVITSRVTRKTYGVVLDVVFNEEKHPVSRIFDHEGICYCYGIFSLIAKRNERISTLSQPMKVDYTFGDTELIVVATEKDININFETLY